MNTIVNFACSILNYFGVPKVENPTLELADNVLQREYKNIVVLLLDGMGVNIMERNLKKDGFFSKNSIGTYHSVFPPTTVAATTSFNSGLFPVQHGWLGWDCYYKEINKNVSVFLNTESGTTKPASTENVAWKYCSYQTVIDQIKEAGVQAYTVSRFVSPYPNSFAAICNKVEELCNMEGRKYIYAYWGEPDNTMHQTGCYSAESKEVVCKLEEDVEKFSTQLEDTLLLITADHGHRDSRGVSITEYPKIMDCLIRMPSIEPRALNLFVKPGREKELEKEFQKEFGESFLLLSKEDVKEHQIFGPGKEHLRFDEMLGDYLAIATGNLSIYNSVEEKEKFIGVHAGMTEDEMRIPLIVVERK